MSSENFLERIKKLREITGVGFKDCKIALDENKGDIEKSIEFLRKKGTPAKKETLAKKATSIFSKIKTFGSKKSE